MVWFAMLALTGAAALMAVGSALDSDALQLTALAPLVVALALIVSGLRTAGASRTSYEPLRTGTFTRPDGTTFTASGEHLTATAALVRRVRSR